MARRMRLFWTALGLAVLLSPIASAQMSPEGIVAANRSTETATRTIAANALASARTLGGRIGTLGSDAELAVARLGAAIPVYFVRLDRLRDYTPSTDPLRLLSEPASVYYPVVSGTRTPSLIEVGRARAGSPWKVLTRGHAPLAARLTERVGLTATTNGQQFCVLIAGLSQRFYGELKGAELLLTPLDDSALFDFRRGQTLAAATVFSRLREAARQAMDAPGR